MFTTILSAIPLWVFPLLFGLVWLGSRASKSRAVSSWLVYALPMLGLLSLTAAQGLAQAETALTAMAVAYIAGALWGYRAQAAWVIRRDARRVHLRGEWVTMVTILSLFILNFATGIVQGMAPALAEGATFALGFGLLAGVLSGSLMGRALRVARWPVAA
ncbi:hypothetical protein ROE7235_00932 [Roseibaca ekhonensis]|jgi:putative flippase GtrA|uniref:DUF1453 domain-containing protein n=1 Tax=Roseinatronobacter ekhonensis TaxID=254356 RepID=A0A3B0MTF6_9RHOB|nr:DUF6622 family protein [Roseibaca ekhonensis]SUZ31196.1 hypothetical protein ROE7235_00932 [Roseibaca ekhonensis]